MKYNQEMIYNEKTKKWYKNGKGAGHSLEESCECCGEPYFMRIDKPTKFCCKGCSQSGENNHMYDKTHTDEVKQLLANNIKKTQKTIKDKYGVDNISQLDHIKKKKGQLVISFETVKPLVEERGYQLLSIKGDNKHAVLGLVCQDGHVFEMKWESFNSGRNCIRCYYNSLIAKGVDDVEGFNEYKTCVRNATMRTYRKYKNIINPDDLKRSKKKDEGYQIDHKYSILEGFKNNVPVEVISSVHNLEMLTVTENASKQDRCSITLEELMEKYNNEKFV